MSMKTVVRLSRSPPTKTDAPRKNDGRKPAFVMKPSGKRLPALKQAEQQLQEAREHAQAMIETP